LKLDALVRVGFSYRSVVEKMLERYPALGQLAPAKLRRPHSRLAFLRFRANGGLKAVTPTYRMPIIAPAGPRFVCQGPCQPVSADTDFPLDLRGLHLHEKSLHTDFSLLLPTAYHV